MYFCQNASLEDLYSIFRPGCWVNSFIDRHAKRSQRKRGRPPHARNHCLHHNYQQPSSQQHGRVHFAPNRRQNTFLAISNPQQGLYWWRKVPGQWLWQYVNLICDPEGLIYWPWGPIIDSATTSYLHTYLPPTTKQYYWSYFYYRLCTTILTTMQRLLGNESSKTTNLWCWKHPCG